MAKNTGRGHRVGAVKGRSEFQVGKTWFKRDTLTGRIMNGGPNQHKGVRNESDRCGAGPRSAPLVTASSHPHQESKESWQIDE